MMDALPPESESNHEHGDWSVLSSDLLRLISRKLTNVFDFVKFRVVCKHWRFAAPTSDHHPLLPCLLGRTSNHFLLYCLNSGKTYKIDVPNPQGNNDINVRGPLGWNFFGPIEHRILVGTSGSHSLTLFNPLTKNEVILAPLNQACNPNMWIGLNPTKSSEHVAIHGYDESGTGLRYLSLYRHKEGKWVTIEKNLAGRYPIIYYKGMYYCIIHATGTTEVIDATTGELRSIIPHPKTEKVYFTYRRHFVESSGQLLLVRKFVNYKSSFGPELSAEYYFDMYRLNQENNDQQWEKMSKIADHTLFLGTNTGFSLRSTDSDRFKDNCIYYIDSALEPVKDSSSIRAMKLLRYDIEDAHWEEELSYPFNEATSWILPSLR